MWDYYQLLLEKKPDAIESMQSEHPMQMKKSLALALVERFHSKAVAENELKQFEQVFSKNKQPDAMPSFEWKPYLQILKTSN